MSLLKRAGIPAVTIEPSASVMRAIHLMEQEKVGALFVVDHGTVVGAFTQRDVAFRVVLRRRDSEKTVVGDVMTSPAITLPTHASVAQAIGTMAAHRVRHAPVVDQGRIRGVISLRKLLRERTVNLSKEMDSLVAYHCADGIGG